MMTLLFGVVGCVVSEPSSDARVADRDLYMQASLAISVDDAVGFCGQIQKTDLQGECFLFTAKMAVQQRRDGLAICDRSPTLAWRQVCWFDVADSAGLTGKRAMNICAQTGDFKSRCLYHALQREELSLMKRFALGQEKELQKEIQSRVTSLQIEELKNDPITETLVSRIVARRFLLAFKKDSTLEFSSSFCGTAQPENCIDAYRFVIKMAGKGRLPSNCSLPMDHQRVQQLSFPVWGDAFEKQAQKAWKNLCSHATNRNQKTPDHQASGGRR